jgi:hypothetical protein
MYCQMFSTGLSLGHFGGSGAIFDVFPPRDSAGTAGRSCVTGFACCFQHSGRGRSAGGPMAEPECGGSPVDFIEPHFLPGQFMGPGDRP